VHEDAADLEALDALLTRSRSGASEHLQSIITETRTLDARRLAARLTGMRVLTLATVSASGRPRVSAVDGHFFKGRWVWSTAAGSVKAQDLEARAAASTSHLEGEELGVFAHGDAERVGPEHPDHNWIEDHLTAHYGVSPTTFATDVAYFRLQPRWMTVFAAPSQ
jgi:pyridoxine/pyridoxamine 5'-phosphate oxidase